MGYAAPGACFLRLNTFLWCLILGYIWLCIRDAKGTYGCKGMRDVKGTYGCKGIRDVKGTYGCKGIRDVKGTYGCA